MKKSIKTLIIDDHFLIVETLDRLLKSLELKSDYIFKTNTANNCDTAFTALKEAAKSKNNYDLFFLDISLPPSKTKKLLCGEDLGRTIRRISPNSKIVVFTHHADAFRISSIFSSFNPEGFLIKSEVGHKDFNIAIEDVLKDKPFYSKTVLQLLRKNIISDIVLDEKDRRLLFELSRGTKMKDLPKIINLSMGGVEQRKRHLIEVFNTRNKDDRALIERARQKGFV